MNKQTQEILAQLGCQIEVIEGIHALVDDVLEVYSVYEMGRESKELQSANLKSTVLSNFLKRGVDDLNDSLNELYNIMKEGKK